MAPPSQKLLIYILHYDLRLSDNPVFHELSRIHSNGTPAFTHILPLYVFPAHQVEVSGFIPEGDEQAAISKSPYPEARSQIAGFWRCGPHRAKFLAESVWDLKQSLGRVGSGLVIRVGMVAEIVQNMIDHFEGKTEGTPGVLPGSESVLPDKSSIAPKVEVLGVWMTTDEGDEEKQDQEKVRRVVEGHGKEFRAFQDEKFFIDDRDLPFKSVSDLPDVYTTFRKSLEPLRDRPRHPLRIGELPPIISTELLPTQPSPFHIPDTLGDLIAALLKPLAQSIDVPKPPSWPDDMSSEAKLSQSAHPFSGGESAALRRIDHLLSSGAMSGYKDTRNGLVGHDFSTKLSAWLAIGCVTARQIHAEMVVFEEGTLDPEKEEEKSKLSRWRLADGYGQGENKGTAGVRFELLWRDYFRLVARKYGYKLYHLRGLRGTKDKRWNRVDKRGNNPKAAEITRSVLHRFCEGRTGIGLIDASQREIFLTGYTSNRARQNVASFLAKHLNVDWRLGAEWYESMLVDYDVANNWGNWQYVAGVGNDPREGRLFNPVKQALDYDKKGEYIKTWVPELRGLELEREKGSDDIDEEKLMGLFQPWRLPESEQKRLGLTELDFVQKPLVKIQFSITKRPCPSGGRGRSTGGYRGRGGHSSSRGGSSRGRGRWRTGDMDKANEAEQSLDRQDL
ncbi:cryptochrome [Tothia fuscella]|uniref:Cryptochrome DASH n=1 Tax=Tothia fuscella TaxID=1048955 RepID=A0A9P4NS29_9PEZI|nr:cryptochrome [Tothia fuscella]